MTEEEKIVAAEKEVETDTTQDSSPQSKEETTDTQTEQPAKEEKDTLPEKEEEQRRAFQEMRQELKKLREEQQEREQSESAFETFKQTAPVVNQDQFVDPTTGEVDWQAVNIRQTQAARATAQEAAREELDEFQARKEFPDLFKDKEIERDIADQWFASKMRGSPRSITEIAKKMNARLGKAITKAEKEGAKKILQEVGTKEQAGLTAPTQSSGSARQAQKISDLEKIKEATRYGDLEATVARMKQIPWAGNK